MRVGVLGAGAMGGTVAALLDRAGHEVEVTARGPHLDAIREGGIRLSGGFGAHLARVDAAGTLTLRPDLVVVATKAMDAATAVTANLPLIEGVPLVVLQNGLGGMEQVAEAAPANPVVGALALFGASLIAPGEVLVTYAAATYLGRVSGPDEAADRAAEVLGALLPVEVVEEFEGARWAKLVVNQVNALPAITGLSVQQVIRHRGLRTLLTRGMREAVQVGLARGVRFATLNGIGYPALLALSHAPLTVGQLLPLLMAKRMGSVPNPGSTLQSIRRGQPSEIDYLNGAVIEQAKGTGVQTPVNALLLALVHEVERTRRHLRPVQVLRRARNL